MKHIVRAAFLTTGAGMLMVFAFSLQYPDRFFSNDARTAYFLALMLTLFAALSMKRLLSYKTRTVINYTPKYHEAKNSGLSILVLLLFIVSPMLDASGKFLIINSNWLRWIGCLFLVDAITFFTWGSWVLGKTFYSADKKPLPLKLVKVGPYAIIRHPRYLGLMAFGLSTALVFNNYGALLLATGVIFIVVLKANDDETRFELEFGKEWQAYKKHTYRFIPMVY